MLISPISRSSPIIDFSISPAREEISIQYSDSLPSRFTASVPDVALALAADIRESLGMMELYLMHLLLCSLYLQSHMMHMETKAITCMETTAIVMLQQLLCSYLKFKMDM